MAKNKYYLANLYVDYNDNYDLISTNIKYTLSELKKLGIHYLDYIPSYEMLYSTCDEICDDVLEYNKLTELLWDYLFYFEIYDDEVKVEDINLDYIKDRLNKLTSEYFVLRYKKQENKFSIINKKEIERLSNEIIFKFENKSHEFLTEFLTDIQKMIEFDDEDDELFDGVVSNINSISHDETYKIDNFFNELESLIEHESCVVSLSNGSSFSIFKDNGRLHKEFIKSGFDKNNKPNKNGNHYEFNKDELKNFVLYHLLMDRKLGFSISAFLKKSENKKIPMSKKYGFYMYYVVEKNRFDLVDKIVKYSDKLNERNEVLNYQYHRNGEYHYGQITKPIYYSQNKDMFDYLIKLGAEYNEDDYKQIMKNTYSNAQSNIKEFFKI